MYIIYVYKCMFIMCVCVCVRERERERERVCGRPYQVHGLDSSCARNSTGRAIYYVCVCV